MPLKSGVAGFWFYNILFFIFSQKLIYEAIKKVYLHVSKTICVYWLLIFNLYIIAITYFLKIISFHLSYKFI